MDALLGKALADDPSQLLTAEKQHLLTRLLARMAHEIRNPLSSIDIHVQLLQEDFEKWPPELREAVGPRFEIIRGELHRLENIVQHFLRLGSPSELNLEEMPPGKPARQVSELLRPEAEARQIALRLKIDERLPELKADPVQLNQALINLVINALQAVETRGWVEIDVSGESGWIVYRISDSGPGVPIEKSATIFEPYFTTRPQGTGLGLWIVQQVASAHGGLVRVGNAPGSGAVFILKFPLTKEPNG